MTFISYLKYKNLLCHGKKVVLEERIIYCQECNNEIINMTDHLTKELDFLTSCQVAKYYVDWSGDDDIPCKIKIIHIPGIMPADLIVPYSHLLNATELLGMANQEFIIQKNDHFNKKESLKKKILEEFAQNYRHPNLKFEQQDVQTIIMSLLEQMQLLFEGVDVFEFYFNVLCPYVKSCQNTKSEVVVKENDISSPGEFFLTVTQDANEIRAHFGKYCVAFDVVYVLIYLYLCKSNEEILVNFAMDLIARICRGYFNESNKYIKTTDKIIKKLVNYKQNTQLYFLIKCIRKGEVVEHISLEFMQKYGELQQLILNEFTKQVSAPTGYIQKYAYSNCFPFVLFPNTPNYIGFICMLGYVMNKLTPNSGTFEKGILSNAKFILKFVEDTARKIAEFETEGTKVLYWNSDVLQLYLSYDESVVKKIADIVSLLPNTAVPSSNPGSPKMSKV